MPIISLCAAVPRSSAPEMNSRGAEPSSRLYFAGNSCNAFSRRVCRAIGGECRRRLRCFGQECSLDEFGIDHAFDEGGVREDAEMEGGGGFDAFDAEFFQGAFH